MGFVAASDLDRAYDYCQRVARARARNFYYVIRMLPRPKRRAIYATYAVCRLWDDIADDDMSSDRKRALFVETRRSLASAFIEASGGANGIDPSQAPEQPPEFVALSDTARAYNIPSQYFEAVLDGVESDLATNRYANFAELRDYCRKVASAVGLICISIFGYEEPSAERYAEDMGIALQLTNVLRDIKEDAERDRIYIPQDEMAEFGYGEDDLARGVIDDRFKALMEFQVERARSYYERSRPLFDLVEPEARACLRGLHTAYGAILERIERNGYDVFSRRIGLSGREKFAIAARLWIGGIAPTMGLFRQGR